MLAVYRALYVQLGTLLGAVAGYLFARYFVMLFGVGLHLYFPEHYSFEHVMAVLHGTRSWLRPLVTVGCASWAAVVCYRFCRASTHPI
jgi:ABC-type dipeptide/oligopeptide/nickel transport system permease subunit